MQSSDAGTFQSGDGVLVRQFKKAHAAFVSLLLNLMGGLNPLYINSRGRADALCPTDKTVSILLQIFGGLPAYELPRYCTDRDDRTHGERGNSVLVIESFKHILC